MTIKCRWGQWYNYTNYLNNLGQYNVTKSQNTFAEKYQSTDELHQLQRHSHRLTVGLEQTRSFENPNGGN